MGKRIGWVAVAAVATGLALSPGAVSAAQDSAAPRVAGQEDAPGRVGVRFLSRREYTLGSGQPPRTIVVIEDVLPGSAAERAGVRIGDIVLQINGLFPSEALLTQIGPQLRAGDSLQMVVRRAGESLDHWVVAEARPPQEPANPRLTAVTADGGVVGAWPFGLRREESESEGFTIVWKSDGGSGQSFSYNFETSQRGGDLPFNAFVVRTPLTDSLMARIQIVRREIQEAFGVARVQDRRRGAPPRGLSIRRVELARELGELQDKLATVSQEQLRVMQLTREGAEEVRVRLSPERVLAPLMQTNRAFLLGAEVTSVNADLGRYFEVDGGVLVSSVPPGTPAERVGLRAGDVIVGTSRGPVVDFMELRRHLLSGGSGLEMTVVRNGEQRTVPFPQQQ